jgi:hypothetical protein
MNKNKLKTWLATLDPMTDWRYDDLQALEQQIVDVVKASGYLNLPLLLGEEAPVGIYTPFTPMQVTNIFKKD